MEKLNDYNILSKEYQTTFIKPDKQFSILPTALDIVGDVNGKTILDLGCGSGFFAIEFANRGAKKVIGIDNSEEQITAAKKHPQDNTAYERSDIFTDELPKADIIFAPHVINYAEDVSQLTALVESIFKSLNSDGKFATIVDLPEDGKNLKKFGAVKTILGEKKDGAKIKIELYNQEQLICTLNAFYFTPQTLENILKNAGFIDVEWHKPIISKDGINTLGEEFWAGYQDSPELGYVSAQKPKQNQ